MAYILKPEVAGGWGSGTVADTTFHPPRVSRLIYEFEGWSGDDLLTTFPCFIVSNDLAEIIERESLSGYTLVSVEVVKSETFIELQPDCELPEFKWLQIHGKLGIDDFSISENNRLVVSEAAFSAISRSKIDQCEVIKC